MFGVGESTGLGERVRNSSYQNTLSAEDFRKQLVCDVYCSHSSFDSGVLMGYIPVVMGLIICREGGVHKGEQGGGHSGSS